MTARFAIVAAIALLTGACDVSMSKQPKYRSYDPSELWDNGTSAQPLPDGVVAQNAITRDEVTANPPQVTPALLARGRERFDIFCSPCHGLDASGKGVIVQHGFPAPPNFHSRELMAFPARRIFDTITNGHGVMYSYADRVEPADRWAIAAYIRALQLAGHAKLADFPQAKEALPP